MMKKHELIPCHPDPRLQTSPVAARADRVLTPEDFALIAQLLAVSKPTNSLIGERHGR